MRMVAAALECGPDAYLEHMFTECGLIAWLVDAPRWVVPAAREGDTRSAERRPCRAGCGPGGQVPCPGAYRAKALGGLHHAAIS